MWIKLENGRFLKSVLETLLRIIWKTKVGQTFCFDRYLKKILVPKRSIKKVNKRQRQKKTLNDLFKLLNKKSVN